MGIPKYPQRVNLIAGLIGVDDKALNEARLALRRAFGDTDFAGPIMDFTHTDYYEKEMGPSLKRQILSFKRLVGHRGISRVKLISNRLEARLSQNGRRRVNIDPGYLDLSKLVLFSTKDYTHRIHIDRGIFAEVTLYYMNRCFKPWPWTYPDYASDQYTRIFNKIRDIYRDKI